MRLGRGRAGLGGGGFHRACDGPPEGGPAGWVGSTPEKSQAFAQRFGFARAHDELASLLRDPAVDAVYLALPNSMHHEAVLAAARAKKHILCEKPFAMSVAHAREMV